MPRIGKVLEAGNGEPIRPAAILEFAIHFRPAQHAGGVEVEGADLGDATRALGVSTAFSEKKGRVGIGAINSPVKPGMGVEDIKPAAQQEQDAQRIDPVGQPHQRAMAVEALRITNGAEGVAPQPAQESRPFPCGPFGLHGVLPWPSFAANDAGGFSHRENNFHSRQVRVGRRPTLLIPNLWNPGLPRRPGRLWSAGAWSRHEIIPAYQRLNSDYRLRRRPGAGFYGQHHAAVFHPQGHREPGHRRGHRAAGRRSRHRLVQT